VARNYGRPTRNAASLAGPTLLQTAQSNLISGLAGLFALSDDDWAFLPEIGPLALQSHAHPRADYARRSDRFAHGRAPDREWSMSTIDTHAISKPDGARVGAARPSQSLAA